MGFKEIGRKIQKAREERGLTQAELAQALGITQAGLSNYELGKRRIYLHQIERIAEILGKDIGYFTSLSEAAEQNAESSQSLREAVLERIAGLSDEDLAHVKLFVDFLVWRKGHG